MGEEREGVETSQRLELGSLALASVLARKKDSGWWQAIVYSEPRNSNPMNPKVSESTVDRLIAMAAEEKPAEPRNALPGGEASLESLMLGEQGLELEHNPAGSALLQFRMLAPYVSQLLEMSHANASPALTTELKQSMGDLTNSQRELKLTMQDQVAQMKHLEEEIVRAKELTERNVTENIEIVEDVRAVQSTVKKAAISLGALLTVLIGVILWLAVRGIHFH